MNLIKEIMTMKKILAIVCLTLFIIPLFSGCLSSKESPTVDYTTEILIDQEKPPEDLVWYAKLEAPTSGNAIIPIPSYSIYAIFNTSDIKKCTRRSYSGILDAKAPFEDTFFDEIAFIFNSKYENEKHNYRLKVLGMTSEEYDQKIKKYFDLDKFNYYNDRVIGIIYPVIFLGETEEVTDAEYANKNILVDYNYETSVVIPYTDEELKAENGGFYSTSYIGRIGDRYYLPYGYYDIIKRELCAYKDENDLPPFNEALGVDDQYDLLRIIKKDPDAAKYIPDSHFISSYTLLGDRYYAVIDERNSWYESSIDDYNGNNVFLITVDAVTGEVLYLQKYHLENYWGYSYNIYALGEDGILYDLMLY